MTVVGASDLLRGNEDHVAGLSAEYFDSVRDGQHPPVVSVCCSDSRVSQEGMFDVSEPGKLFTPSNIGNQVRDRIVVDGEVRDVVDGSLLYPIVYTDTRTVAIVGHTGCGAITAAYEHATEGGTELAGIQQIVDMLVPVVEDGFREGVGEADDRARGIDELVEYNVDRQVAFLRESADVPGETDVYGFVYDVHGRYGGSEGGLYLVNADGRRDVAHLRDRVDEDVTEHVSRLTEYYSDCCKSLPDRPNAVVRSYR